MENKVENNDHIVTLDGVDYKYSELPDMGKISVRQLNILEKEILDTRLLLDRHEAAKKTFIDQFKSIVENKEEINSD
ncbi:MAG: hypothetical protein HOC66_05880 [Flavobacteriales bacterium]|jgi:hypothetical protein|nr:hypothetical protein [Flavobacteriales bacterium]